MRALLPTPSALSLPALICGIICASEPTAICVLPAITSIIAGPPPLNGTWTMSMPACCLKSSAARCWKLPTPAVA
jgi:hypothetical protein